MSLPWEFPLHVYSYCHPGTAKTGRCQCKKCKSGKFRAFVGRNLRGEPLWRQSEPGGRKKDIAWAGELHVVPAPNVVRPEKYSRSDRVAYWRYIRVALAAGVSPLSAEQWLLLAGKPSLPKYPRGGQTDEERTPTHKEQQREELFADIAQMGGFAITSMRPGGSFGGVRRQTSANSEGMHLLTFKTCKKCLELLPRFCFAKQLKGRRGSCRWCDNAARVERRRNQKEELRRNLS
jgi:hypothetical protein